MPRYGNTIIDQSGILDTAQDKTLAISKWTICKRVDPSSDLCWKKYPTSKDENEINDDQILTWGIDGMWDYTSIRNAILTLKNHITIDKMFHSAVL